LFSLSFYPEGHLEMPVLKFVGKYALNAAAPLFAGQDIPTGKSAPNAARYLGEF